MAKKKAEAANEKKQNDNEPKIITIKPLIPDRMHVCVLGTTPMIMNAPSAKAKRELLLPAKVGRTEQEQYLKHDPVIEYRQSIHLSRMDDGPTRLVFPASGFKTAMSGSALDVPGGVKTVMERLTWIRRDQVPIWGVPRLLMSWVRNRDMNRTPDIRTRAIVWPWASRFTIEFVRPNLNEETLGNLLAAAGLIRGIGDYRQEKGRGSYGQFELVNADDARLLAVMAEGDREAQAHAIANPRFYDEESRELFEWFQAERLTAAHRDKKKPRRSVDEAEEQQEAADGNSGTL